jgi:hypothetical protein
MFPNEQNDGDENINMNESSDEEIEIVSRLEIEGSRSFSSPSKINEIKLNFTHIK